VKQEIKAVEQHLDTKIDALEQRHETKIEDVELDLTAHIAESKAELKQEIGAVRERLSSVEAGLRYLQWSIGSVGFGVLLLILKSFWPS
jgi:chromosome segregation ATPase